MKLYTAAGACSLACHISFEEAGIPYEAQLVSLDKGETSTPEYLKMNPNGAVPLLKLDNGDVLTEGPAIMQYIADQAPEKNLFPKSGTERYHALEWLNFVTSELHKGTYGLLWAAESLVSEMKAQEELVSNAKGMLDGKLQIVDQKLAGKTYAMGNQFTVIDAYLFTILSWSDYLDVDLKKYTNISTYKSRVFERPAVQKVMKAEGLL